MILHTVRRGRVLNACYRTHVVRFMIVLYANMQAMVPAAGAQERCGGVVRLSAGGATSSGAESHRHECYSQIAEKSERSYVLHMYDLLPPVTSTHQGKIEMATLIDEKFELGFFVS